MILIASPSADRIRTWAGVLDAFGTVRAVDHADAVRSALLCERPEFLVLDFAMPGLDTPKAVARARALHGAIRVVVMADPLDEDIETALFTAGVRGICRNDIDPQLLKRVVVAVRLGELWIRRSLMSRLLDASNAAPFSTGRDGRPGFERLAYLTEREREIASLVGSGGTNKQIARQLHISERTVKAHLTGIFRKLRVDDRLKLALLVAEHGKP